MLTDDLLTDDALIAELRSAFGSAAPARVQTLRGAPPCGDDRRLTDVRRLTDGARRARRRHRTGVLAGTGACALAVTAAVVVPGLAAPRVASPTPTVGFGNPYGHPHTGPRAGVPVPTVSQGTAHLQRVSLAGYTVLASLPAGTRTDDDACTPVAVPIPGGDFGARATAQVAGSSPCLAGVVMVGGTITIPAGAHAVTSGGRTVQIIPRPDGGLDAIFGDGATKGDVALTFVVGSRGLSEAQVAAAAVALLEEGGPLRAYPATDRPAPDVSTSPAG
jgi:hypothetical protein